MPWGPESPGFGERQRWRRVGMEGARWREVERGGERGEGRGEGGRRHKTRRNMHDRVVVEVITVSPVPRGWAEEGRGGCAGWVSGDTFHHAYSIGRHGPLCPRPPTPCSPSPLLLPAPHLRWAGLGTHPISTSPELPCADPRPHTEPGHGNLNFMTLPSGPDALSARV